MQHGMSPLPLVLLSGAVISREAGCIYGVSFTSLIAIANNPSGRFAEALASKGDRGRYMRRLVNAFNVATCDSMMCRDQIGVDWRGKVYDCDFNQAIQLPLYENAEISHFASETPKRRRIRFGQHCCTAGAGSSCCGATDWGLTGQGNP